MLKTESETLATLDFTEEAEEDFNEEEAEFIRDITEGPEEGSKL